MAEQVLAEDHWRHDKKTAASSEGKIQVRSELAPTELRHSPAAACQSAISLTQRYVQPQAQAITKVFEKLRERQKVVIVLMKRFWNLIRETLQRQGDEAVRWCARQDSNLRPSDSSVVTHNPYHSYCDS